MRLTSRRLVTSLLLTALACVFATTAWSQGLVQGSDAQPVTAPNEPSLWSEMIGWIYLQQRVFHQELIDGMRSLTEHGGAAAAWTLISASFLYGIFHAAGPGHGKAVLTTYLVTHREQMKRGVLLAVISAFTQGFVAIALVYGLILVAGWLPQQTSEAVSWSERASFALLTLLGAYLIYRAARSGVKRWRGQQAGCCGHSHAPTEEQIAATGSFRATLGVVLSIGLRPCTGAVLVLVFAQVVGFYWAGVAAVAAMSAGTAIAVSVLAFAAVNARSFAGRLVASRGGGWMFSADLVALGGGVLLALIGYSLLLASFGPRHPLGL